MWQRCVLALIALVLAAAAAQAQGRRVALVIGQNAYPGGGAAVKGLAPLANPRSDAERIAKLLAKAGFELISCDGPSNGKVAGCFDLNGRDFAGALDKLRIRAQGADLALVFFAGHGMATEQGNILAPTDARIDCATGAATRGVLVEDMLKAAAPARDKLVILDACRDNPLTQVCPGLVGKKLAFTRIEPGAIDRLLIVTSTQAGQQALDGPPGTNSPFATALLEALDANPGIYFEQVMNEVARATAAAARTIETGFIQLPGKVVGGAAPADCLAGKGCVGDARMAALAQEMEGLKGALSRETEMAETAKRYLDAMVKQRGRPLSDEERRRELANLAAATTDLAARNDTRGEEALKRLGAGDATAAKRLFTEAAAARKQAALALAERAKAENREAAKNIRHLAALARPTSVGEAADLYQEAAELDADDVQTWLDYAVASVDAGRLAEAKTAFEQAALKARDANNPRQRYWATLGLGDVASAQGNLASAQQFYETALAIITPVANADALNASWQRDLSASQDRIGDVLVDQGHLLEALQAYNASLFIADRLANADPTNTGWQRDLSVSHNNIGNVLVELGSLAEALNAYSRSLAIRDRLAESDPGNAGWQRDLSVSQNKIGDVRRLLGNLAEALQAYRAALAIADRLAKADPGNALWQRDLSVSHNKIGDVLVKQGGLPEALEAYTAALAIAERLAKADPGNAVWQRDLAVTYNKSGIVRRIQGNRPEALKAFEAALSIADRLAKADALNAGWQRDLSVSHEYIGDMLGELGNLPRALDAFNASLAIRDRLAKANPGNVGWQRDLSVSHNKIGEVLVRQDKALEALKAYNGALAIADRLAKADPGNASWQRDLALSFGRVATVDARLGERQRALDGFKAGRAIIERLQTAAPDNATLPKDLAWFDAQIAALK